MSRDPNPRSAAQKLFWTLIVLILSHAISALNAQQLRFDRSVPSVRLLGGSIGVVTVQVLDGNGNLLTNSSAPITLLVTGPGHYANVQTNSATNGIARFDLTPVALNQVGLYNLAATSGVLVPAFVNIGVEESLMPPQGSIFAGAWVNPATSDGGPRNLLALEQSCGRTLITSLHYYAWADTVFSAQNLTNALADDAAHARIPIISWHGTYLTNVVSGSEDAAITNAARAIAAYQGPVLLRWFWEMNLHSTSSSTWNYLGYPSDLSDPSASQVATAQTNFLAAWQRIRAVFDANNANNVIWLWNPGGGADSAPGQTNGGYTDGFYPGDPYVDWIGLDAYNRRDDAFVNTYTTDANYAYTNMIAHAKPLLIGETGAYYTNQAHQVAFFDDAAGSLQTNFPQLLGFTYFDASGSDDWALTNLGATNGVTEFSNLVNNVYLSADFPHPLSYAQFQPFSARIHIAPSLTVLPGSILSVAVSVGYLSTNTPTGTVDLYSDTNYLRTVTLTGGSNGYCQVQTTVAVTNAGVHSLVAVYSGDAHCAAGQSWPVCVTVTEPQLSFQSIQVTAGTVLLLWSSVSNQNYQVQFSTNLSKDEWASLGPAILATNSTASTTDSVRRVKRFYRLLTSP